jgi:3-oxoacyl-[acyl-carrier protein] reductase
MDLDFRGKVGVVTGGSRGIGLAIAERLAAEGASVAIAARRPEALAEAHQRIEGQGGRCLAYACDLSVAGEAAGFIDAVRETFGRIDALVCNAGASSGGAFFDQSRADWQTAIELNLFHAVEALQAAAPVMPVGSSALFVASISGRKPVSLRWNYGAAKAALIHAAGSLALELAPRGIRVNALAPGSTLFPGGGWARRSVEDPERFATFVEQEMPGGRLLDVDEVANAALFLVSTRASGINGAMIPVDGAQGRPSW